MNAALVCDRVGEGVIAAEAEGECANGAASFLLLFFIE